MASITKKANLTPTFRALTLISIFSFMGCGKAKPEPSSPPDLFSEPKIEILNGSPWGQPVQTNSNYLRVSHELSLQGRPICIGLGEKNDPRNIKFGGPDEAFFRLNPSKGEQCPVLLNCNTKAPLRTNTDEIFQISLEYLDHKPLPQDSTGHLRLLFLHPKTIL